MKLEVRSWCKKVTYYFVLRISYFVLIGTLL